MRPRPVSRGDPIQVSPSSDHWWSLQCGHGPSAVETWATVGNTARIPLALQCGHGPSAVETLWPLEWWELDHYPSMRPRPVSRGDSPMIPLRLTAVAALQCGHGPSAVETELGAQRDIDSSAPFNAATARQPWRPGAVVARNLCCVPSMRPRPVSRGDVRAARSAVRSGSPSMRPRPVSRGDCGATVRARWLERALQCGHGPSAVETIKTPCASSLSTSSFNAATARQPWRLT